MKTWSAKAEEVQRNWWVVDAEDKTLGRMASEIAKILRGKTKPTFTPHVDTGDFVVVVNSDKVKLTGNKALQKKYYWKSRFFGSLRESTNEELMQKDSREVVQRAVKGMLPKTPLGRKMIKKMKIYTGAEHPHSAQKPEALSFN